MSDSFALKDKQAVVFGAGGSIGSAVVRAFGAEGAEVFLAGRNKSNVAAVAGQIHQGSAIRPPVAPQIGGDARGRQVLG